MRRTVDFRRQVLQVLQVMELAGITLPEDRWIPIARQRTDGAHELDAAQHRAA